MTNFKNIENARISILENVNIGDAIENIAPITMQGSSVKQNLIEALNNGSFQSIVEVSTAIYETRKVQNVDEQLKKFTVDVENKLTNEGIKLKLIYMFEAIDKGRQTVITERALATIDELVGLNEDQIKTSVRAGKLNPFQTLKFVPQIIESCNIVAESSIETNNVKVEQPISYFESTDQGVYFRSGSKVFCMNENSLRETSAPSSKFTYISSIVEALSFVDECFVYNNSTLGSFKIDKTGIKKASPDGIFEAMDVSEFTNKMTLLIEGADFGPGISGRRESASNRSACDALVAISENFDSIAKLNNVYESVSKNGSERVLFVKNESNFSVAVVESLRQARIVETFTDVRDAIRSFEAKTTVNLSEQFADVIAESVKTDTAKSAAIVEHKELIEGLKKQKADIETEIDSTDDEEIKEEFNGTLKIVEQTLVEQRTALDVLLK